MQILEIDKRVKGDMETIWEILTDMKSFSETAPDIVRVEHLSGEALGMVKRIHHKSGRSWEEECKESETMHQYIEGRKWREVAMQIGRSAASEEFN